MVRKSRSGAVQDPDPQQPAAGLSRRRLFGLAGAGAAGVAVAGVNGGGGLRGAAGELGAPAGATARAPAEQPAAAGSTAADAVAFHGPRQAGIVTAQQDRLHFVAF